MTIAALLIIMMGLTSPSASIPSASISSTIVTTSRQEPATAVSYDVDASLTFHEPVVVTFTVENKLATPIVLQLGRNRTEHFQLVAKQGALRTRPVDLGEGGIAALGEVTITPGAHYTQRLLLDDWFVFEQPGTYEIEIGLSNPIRAQAGGVVPTPTRALLHFQILPRNENVLRERCAHLVARVTTAQPVREIHESARELGAVRDPIAVRYIGEVLDRTDKADFILVPALGRLGGSGAKAVMDRLAQGPSPERASLARTALSKAR
jgi:hypothetical protein